MFTSTVLPKPATGGAGIGSNILGIGMPSSLPTQAGLAEMIRMLQDPQALAEIGQGQIPLTSEEQAILQAITGGQPANSQQVLDLMTLLELIQQLKQTGTLGQGATPGAAFAQALPPQAGMQPIANPAMTMGQPSSVPVY